MLKIIQNHKMKILIIFFLCIAVITVTLTLAFKFTVTDSLTNKFELGEITTTIEEDPKVDNSGKIKKDPQVKNDGPNDAMIRMRVNVSPSIVEQYLKKYNCIAYNDDPEFDTSTSAYWIYNEKDGFWYYNHIVTKGETTEPLFKEIAHIVDEEGNVTSEFKQFIGNYSDFQITLYQEAVQTVIYENGEVYKEGNIEADVSDEENIDIRYNQNAQLIWKIYSENTSS